MNFFSLPSIFVYLLGSLVFEQEKNEKRPYLEYCMR